MFDAVPPDALQADPLPDDLREKLRRCVVPSYLGQGVQVFNCYRTPAVSAALEPFMRWGPEPVDVPLALAPKVLRRLTIAAEHPEQVYLIRHAFSVEIIDLALREGYIFCAEPAAEAWWKHPYNYVINEGLRRLFCAFMPDRGSFPLHSSAVAINGQAALLVAADGGGKSTAAGLSPADAVILCDDCIILRQHDDGPHAYSTPWGRITSGPLNLPLGAVFLLEKAAAFELVPVSKRDVMAFLWQDNDRLWAQLPVRYRLRAYDDLAAMINAVPSYRLRFPRDYIDWDAVASACCN